MTVVKRTIKKLTPTRRLQEVLSVIQQISVDILSTHEFENLLWEVVASVYRTYESDYVGVYLVEGDQLVLRAGVDREHVYSEDSEKVKPLHGADKSDVITWVANHGESVLVNKAEKSAKGKKAPVELRTAKSELAIPIMHETVCLGVLDVKSNQARQFNKLDKHVLHTISQLIALALVNVRLFEKEKTRVNQLQLTNMINRVILGTNELGMLYKEFVKIIYRSLRYEHVSIWEYQEKHKTSVLRAIAGKYDHIKLDYTLNISEGLIGLAIKTKHSQLYNNVKEAPTYVGFVDQDPIGSEFCAPIIVQNEVVAVLNIESEKQNAFDRHDELTLTTVAGQLANAIFKIQLFEHVKHNVDKLELINQVGSELTSTLDLSGILKKVLMLTKAIFEYDSCDILLYDEDKKVLEVKATDRLVGKNVQNEGEIVKTTEGIIGMAFRVKKIIVIGDVSQDPHYVEKVSDTQSEMAIPLIYKDTVIGVFNLESRFKNHFNDESEYLLNILTKHISISVMNARLHEKNAQAYEQLSKAQSELVQSEKLASLGLLVAGIAHEINNPTTFVFGNLEILEEYVAQMKRLIEMYEQVGKLADEDKKLIAKYKELIDYNFMSEDISSLMRSCVDGAKRIRQLVLDLRSFSRIDEAEEKVVDIHEGIDSTLSLFINQFRESLEVTKEYGQLPQIKCYANQVNQVIMNILINAAHAIVKKINDPKYADYPKGKINIKTSHQGQFVCIRIEDDGIGIPEEAQKNIYDPFFTTKPVGQGTGLGLTISYNIVEKHHGVMTFETSAGKGTKFNIKLPVNHED